MRAARVGAVLSRKAVSAVLLLGAACAGDEAGGRTIPEGRYHYVASHPAPGEAQSVELEGVLVITWSGRDSIAGVWEVPELQPDLDLGEWRGDAYEVMANPTYFGVLTNRLRRQGERILCEGDYTWVAEGGVERTVPVTCSVSPDAGERPEMPARGEEDPIIRRIDPDSVPPRELSPDAAAGPRDDSAGGVRSGRQPSGEIHLREMER